MMSTREARHLERAGRVPPADCKCAGCAGLVKRYKSDPDLLAFYQRRLLVKGWAGNADEAEKAYQLAHAPWARDAHEQGIRLQQAMAQRERLPAVGEASTPSGEELATGDGEGDLTATPTHPEDTDPRVSGRRRPAQIAV